MLAIVIVAVLVGSVAAFASRIDCPFYFTVDQSANGLTRQWWQFSRRTVAGPTSSAFLVGPVRAGSGCERIGGRILLFFPLNGIVVVVVDFIIIITCDQRRNSRFVLISTSVSPDSPRRWRKQQRSRSVALG